MEYILKCYKLCKFKMGKFNLKNTTNARNYETVTANKYCQMTLCKIADHNLREISSQSFTRCSA